MIRYKMNRILRLLETSGFDAARDQIVLPDNARAIAALEDAGCIKVERSMGGVIVYMSLKCPYGTYHLERQELWLNRIIGFVFGVITSYVIPFIIQHLA